MKRSAKARQVAEDVLKAFETGEVPRALALVFVGWHGEGPSAAWSWRNRLIAALRGHVDARGFRQWQQAGRQVRKGERAFYILAPCTVRAKEADEERGIEEGDRLCVGFSAIPVFGYTQTEGEPLPGAEREAEFLDALPLIDVARSWGIEVLTYNGQDTGRLGFFNAQGQRIALAVENLSTWAHELVHAADHRCGTLSGGRGQKLDNEVVAELGGTVLLECLGHSVESDRGHALAYLRHYAEKHGRSVLSVCSELLDRVCSCVALILEAAEGVGAAGGAREQRSAEPVRGTGELAGQVGEDRDEMEREGVGGGAGDFRRAAAAV